ncbi:hypothetical protein RO21_02135 [[Actinobacillus] muris]|uniref:Uncharacterized protein n=1 Tax=Muribacter muris TaxID=67855 RepID=A0A0J5P742_9PAST|nr:hypothetical protein [Muribacter muris]KMK52213.1 hypothetical protein RO21_02135 [[Actinobacillus] muris] [Muribacter muris]
MKEIQSKLIKEKIGFSIVCLYSGVIKFNEFKQWLYNLINNTDVDKLPSYIWDLIDVETGENANISLIVDSDTNSGLDEEQENALMAIALERDPILFKDFDPHITKKKAFRAFKRFPSVLNRVKEEFYFIEELQKIREN